MDDLAGLSWSSGQKKGASNSQSSQRTGAFAPNYSPSLSSGLNPSSRSQSSASQQPKDDPFGELVSFTGSSQKSQAKLSLRERQQMLEKEQSSRSSSPFSFQQTAQPSDSSSMFPKTAKDTWNFDAFESIGSTSRSATPAQQQTSARVPKASNVSMDFDPLAAPASKQDSGDLFHGFGIRSTQPDLLAAQPPAAQNSASRAQDAFSSSDDEPIPMDTRQPAREAFADRDFEIAQVAGYGFSVEQSKAALEITGSPRAAIQLLREQKAAARNAPKPEMQQKPPAGRSRLRTPYRDEPGRADDSSSDDELYYDDPRHNRRHEADRRRDNARPQQADQGGSDSFLTTANELGTSMLKQANSWFAMGKKKFMEIQESVEQRRWPGNDAEAEWNRADFEPGYAGSGSRRYRDYSDSSSDDEPYVSASRHARQPAKTFEPFESTKPRQRPAHAAEPIMDMMGDFDAAPVAIPRQQQPRPSAAPSQTQSTPTPARKQQSPAAIPIVSDNILVAATTAKISANAQFKLGQYGEAAAGYSVAISQVSQHSDSHPVLILLLNNRALAYARNGEAKMAVTDCTQALQLIDRFQTNGTIELGQAGRVDMGEQRAKTLQRRAEAFESSERYQDGLSDWKALREIARDAGMRQQSTRGVQRCERALGISQTPKRPVAAETPEPAKPEDLANVFASISIATVKSGGPTILTAHTENSAAVAEMRRKEQVRRDEDDQRMAIHDHVEAELRQWKDGKQQNLRALLSSVHLLLPSFTPIGMHEIIEAAKVKRAYMRTIARLHPDKLTKDIDVRTKMVSSSVFTSLNEAWDTFKAQEGVS